jgi:TIR domain
LLPRTLEKTIGLRSLLPESGECGMKTVFISYRRENAAGEARALFNDLVTRLGKASVFMDVDSIALGRDFRGVLQEILVSCDLMLVMIGKDWANIKDERGRARLEDPRDFVRLEIEAALKRDIVVTPVLVQGAHMPTPEQLPSEIRDLAYRNGFELSHNRWESDVREMVRRLAIDVPDRSLSRWNARMSSIWTFVRKPSNQQLFSWLGGGGAVAAAGIWGVITYLSPTHETSTAECVQQGVKIGGNVSGSRVSNTVSGGTETAGPCLDATKK